MRWRVVGAAVMADRMVAPVVTPRRDTVVTTPSTSTHGGPGNRLLVLGCRHALRAVLSVGALCPSVWPHLIVFCEICFITISYLIKLGLNFAHLVRKVSNTHKNMLMLATF